MSRLTREIKIKVDFFLVMPSCGVPLCSSYSSKKVKADDCKVWHYLPADRDKRQQWLTVIRRENTPDFPDFPPDFSICGLHFSEECFERDLKHELTGSNGHMPCETTQFRRYLTSKGDLLGGNSRIKGPPKDVGKRWFLPSWKIRRNPSQL